MSPGIIVPHLQWRHPTTSTSCCLCFTTLMVKNFFPVSNLNLHSFSLKQFCLVHARTWKRLSHLSYWLSSGTEMPQNILFDGLTNPCPHCKGAPDLGSSWWPSPEQIQQVNLLPMHDDGKEYSASHCLRSLCVWKMLLEPILEMKLLIILLHSVPLWLIRGNSGFLFASAIAPDKRLGNFHLSALNFHTERVETAIFKGVNKVSSQQSSRTLETFAKSLQNGWNTSCPREEFLLHLFTSNKTHLWLGLCFGIFNKRRYSTPTEEIRILRFGTGCQQKDGRY